MFNIVLYQPQIPENTGNIIRLAANSNAVLHLIRPYGFIWDNSKRKRAALDYEYLSQIKHHSSFEDFAQSEVEGSSNNFYLATTHAKNNHTKCQYKKGDYLIFGAETFGVHKEVTDIIKQHIRIPMQPDSRSLNLSNSVAIVLYEALKQNNFGELF